MFSSGLLSALPRPIDMGEMGCLPHAAQAASAGRKEKLLVSQKKRVRVLIKRVRFGTGPFRDRFVGASALTQSLEADGLVLCD